MRAIIDEHLGYLNFAPGTIDRFTRDYTAGRKGIADARHIVTWFLFSTDFFPAADQEREIRYVGYYDAFDGSCSNPLAQYGFDD